VGVSVVDEAAALAVVWSGAERAADTACRAAHNAVDVVVLIRDKA